MLRCKIQDRTSTAKGSLADEPFIGIWRDREDLADSSTWVRSIRDRRLRRVQAYLEMLRLSEDLRDSGISVSELLAESRKELETDQ